MTAPEREPTPGGATARALGLTAAAAAVGVLVAHWTVPVVDLPGIPSPTLADLSLATDDVAVAVQCVLVAVVGLAVAARPAVGPGPVAASLLTLPWLLSTAALTLEPDAGPGLLVVAGLVLVLAAAGTAALVLAARAARAPAGPGATGDGLALAAAVTGLVATVGVGWYRLVDVTEGQVDLPSVFGLVLDTSPQGGLLGFSTWAGRGGVVGLVLAVAALVLVAASTGATRRWGGVALAALLVGESTRRGLMPAEDLVPGSYDLGLGVDLVTVELLPLGLLVPLVGAAAGLWFATHERAAGEVGAGEPEAAPSSQALDPEGR